MTDQTPVTPAPAAVASGVGERIKEARRARGMTQADLADAVGVSRSAVAQWETDRAGQVRGNLTRIAVVLGVSVQYLLDGNVGRSDSEAPQNAAELAVLRLYRACTEPDRAFLLRTARRLARAAAEDAAGRGDT